MYVPSDTFGGRTREAKASQTLTTLFTAVALRYVGSKPAGSEASAVQQQFPLCRSVAVGRQPLTGAPLATAAQSAPSCTLQPVALRCCRVVLSQLGGGGEGGDLPPTPQYSFLQDYLSAHPLTADADAWLAALLAHKHGQMLGLCLVRG
jgi:hypothetical protein